MEQLYKKIILAVGCALALPAVESTASATETWLQESKKTIKKIVHHKNVQRSAVIICITLGALVTLYLGNRFVRPKFSLNNHQAIDTISSRITDPESPYDPAHFKRPDNSPDTSGWQSNAQENNIALDVPNPPQRLLSIQNNAGKRISIVQGSITQEGDQTIPWAITNAAKSTLSGGKGVDEAIENAAGRAPYEECQQYRKQFNHGHSVPIGSATITNAGKLEPKVKKIIHAVGPCIAQDMQPTPEEQTKLYAAIANTLYKADKHKMQVVSIPPISSGIFGYPAQDCAKQLIDATLDFMNSNPHSSLQEVRLIDLKNDNKKKLSLFVEELKSRVSSSIA